MKKLLFLFTVMAALVGFTASAFAQPCYNCKGTLRNVDCTGVVQGGACAEFDYDTPLIPASGSGFCTGPGSLDNYRALFDICACADPAYFSTAGNVIGVRMTILVDGVAGQLGAYWSDDSTLLPVPVGAPIGLDVTSATKAAACGLPAYGQTFGTGTYYATSDSGPTSNPLQTLACTVPAANQTTVYSTYNMVASGYIVAGGGFEQSWWWMDIPPIRIDPAVLNSGELVSVRIELIEQFGICPTCALCECVIPVAQVCCGAAAVAPRLFPYFTSLTASAWWNGIALVNTGSTANSVTLTAYVQDGTTDTVTVSVPANGMFVDLVSNITWAGTGTGGLPLYIIAAPSTPGLDGFAMIANGAESMGYLPR